MVNYTAERKPFTQLLSFLSAILLYTENFIFQKHIMDQQISLPFKYINNIYTSYINKRKSNQLNIWKKYFNTVDFLAFIWDFWFIYLMQMK